MHEGVSNVIQCDTPYMMKIFRESHLAIWLRMVKLTEFNVRDFSFLNFNYKSYHWDIFKKSSDERILANLPFSEMVKLKF